MYILYFRQITETHGQMHHFSSFFLNFINYCFSFNNSNITKSAGYDNIGPKLLKCILRYVLQPFLFMYNVFFYRCISRYLKNS